MKNLTEIVAEIKEKTQPVASRRYSVEVKFRPDLSRSYAEAAAMVGMARKKENSTACDRDSPVASPPTMAAADLETPGSTEMAWKTPMPAS